MARTRLLERDTGRLCAALREREAQIAAAAAAALEEGAGVATESSDGPWEEASVTRGDVSIVGEDRTHSYEMQPGAAAQGLSRLESFKI